MNKVFSNPETRPSPNKSSKYDQYIDQVREYFTECKGNVVRVQEKLLSEDAINIPYQSLTWLIRKYKLRSPVTKRAGRYHFEPGEEMQHDTSPHKVTLGKKQVTAQCASLVLAYSRKIFIQYYPRFTRFECKVFLAEALQYMQGSCKRCVIDNTSVIVGRGSGSDAVMAPEMEMFARIYGAHFMAHRIRHADRKARVERPFYYAETNFLVGRTFSDWHDLNQQARDWCDQVANHKPKRVLGMSPDEAWIMEKHALLSLPKVPPPVYVSFQRTVDVEGYVHLGLVLTSPIYMEEQAKKIISIKFGAFQARLGRDKFSTGYLEFSLAQEDKTPLTYLFSLKISNRVLKKSYNESAGAVNEKTIRRNWVSA